MTKFMLVLLIYPGWQTLSEHNTLAQCHAAKKIEHRKSAPIRFTPAHKLECIADWNLPDNITWSY